MQILFSVLLVLAVLLASTADSRAAEQNQQAILDAMTKLAESEFRQHGDDFRVEALPLDTRMKLGECEAPLVAFFPQGRHLAGVNLVGVRCPAKPGWTVYGRVRIDAFASALVLARPLNAGASLTAMDVRLERRNTAELGSHYLTAASQAVGQVLRRPLLAGSILGPEHLLLPKWVRRGEKVSLRAQSADFEVTMTGEALSDAEQGGRVRVRNEQSAKVVEGVATAPGVVSIRF